MPTKTITVTEDAYEKLAAHKREGESFRDAVKRLASANTNPLESAGAYPGLGTAAEAAREEFEEGVEASAHELSR